MSNYVCLLLSREWICVYACFKEPHAELIRQTRKNGVISNYKCVRDEQFIASYIPMQHVESSFHAMWNIKNEKTRFMLEFPRYIPEINFP